MGRRVRLAGVCAKPDRRVAVFYKSEGGYFRHGAMKSRRASLIIVAYFCLSMITVSVLHRLSVCANSFLGECMNLNGGGSWRVSCLDS